MRFFKRMVVGSLIAAALFSTQVNGQDFDLATTMEDMLNSGSEDASTMMGHYLAPIFKGFGYGMNSGWYNTAKNHKVGGVDLMVTVAFAKVPDADLFYEFIPANYTSLSVVGSDNLLPTVAGGASTINLETSVTVDTPTGPITVAKQFPAPGGIQPLLDDIPVVNLKAAVPMPMAQLTIGLIKNTDLTIRFVPNLAGDSTSFKMFGLGVKHDVKQWIPGIKKLPFDLAGFFGFTNMNFSAILQEPGQMASYSMYATTGQVIVSKKLLVFTPYFAVGFNQFKSKVSLEGDYTIEDDINPALAFTITDPLSEKEYKGGGLRSTIGGRLKLAVFTFHADYTIQEYNTFTAGFGISVR